MLDTKNTTIVCIDIQEKLVNMLANGETLKNNILKIMKAASVLDINTIITEQYPKGLGSTVSEISDIKKFDTVEKNSFSAYKTDVFKEQLDSYDAKNILIFGIETHICVLQTVLDLLKKGYEVFIIEDCCSSRSEKNHNVALNLAQSYGARVTTLEIVLFDLLKSSKHPNFKEIQSLIK